MKICIAIPTLNEDQNIEKIYKKIIKIKINTDILFIDDSSSDKSRIIIKKLAKKNSKVSFIFRNNKTGIGSAHKDAINYMYKKKYDYIITMDADGTHDPIHIKKMIKIILKNRYQLVSTNRFLNKDPLTQWSLWRRFLTKLRYFLILFLLGSKYDSSGAYRCYNVNKINKKDILKAKSNNYSFFWESMFFLSKKYRIYEIPINLPGRTAGKSKMKFKHIVGALLYLIKFFIAHRILSTN